MSSIQRFTGLLCMAALSFGCSGSRALDAGSVKDAQSAINTAQQAGASQDPEANQHLELAERQAREAKRLADKGETVKGNLLLQQSKADAELAAQLTRTKSEQDKVRDVMTKAQQLASGGQP
jgi:hypothetical protein